MNLAASRRSTVSRAFTLVELIVVIVVLAILSGVAIPRYIDYSARAKEAASRGVLGGVRSAIANFYANSALTGTPAFPTLAEVNTLGTVMQEPIPANPYNSSATVVAAVWATTPPISGSDGYNYDASAGKFWLNSTTSGVNEHLW